MQWLPRARLMLQPLQSSVPERLVGDEGGLNVRLAQVQAQLANAELNLSYCHVTAPVAGYVTNLNIVRGEYANQGLQVFSIVDDSVWYVLANYRETLLDRIEPGMVADIWLLACPGRPLRGVVEGVSNAIYQSVGANVDGLADIAPALDWVRLAQRFACANHSRRRSRLQHAKRLNCHSTHSTRRMNICLPDS